MNTFRNTDTHRRVWPSITKPDGTTLELGPSEAIELDLPRTFTDAHLESVKKPTKKELEQDPQDETADSDAGDDTTTDDKEPQAT